MGFYHQAIHLSPDEAPRDAVTRALTVVQKVTRLDARDPANWVAPEDADWAYITRISRAIWDLLGQESDPFNTLHCESGGEPP